MRVRLGTLRKLIREEIDMREGTYGPLNRGVVPKGNPPYFPDAGRKQRLPDDDAVLSPSALARMAKSRDVKIRCYVAGLEQTPPEVLEQLAMDTEVWDWDGTTPADCVLENPSASEETKAIAAETVREMLTARKAGRELGHKFKKTGFSGMDSDFPDNDPFKSGWGDY